MPNMRVELLSGRTAEQRRRFAVEVTRAAVEELGAREQDVRILFEEIAPDLIANGGVLASDDPSRADLVAKFSGAQE